MLNTDLDEIINNLINTGNCDDASLRLLINGDNTNKALAAAADSVRRIYYGDKVYIRGLIEFSNYCKNNCYYCGIRCDNKALTRYRLSPEDIISCCRKGYALGFRTFVLQSGEDGAYSDRDICNIISSIKELYSDCAITLSIGEKSKDSYKAYFDAGADRYLLRQETSEKKHYEYLHPANMSFINRMRCLYDLAEIGYEVGAGFMVGSPLQTTSDIISDLRFLQDIKPQMIGIGPFLSHDATPFAGKPNGSVTLTLRLISILRLMFKKANIPATTALNTASDDGRVSGIKAGANVIMPNLTPKRVRDDYQLYNNKASNGEEAADGLDILRQTINNAGYQIVTDVGSSLARS